MARYEVLMTFESKTWDEYLVTVEAGSKEEALLKAKSGSHGTWLEWDFVDQIDSDFLSHELWEDVRIRDPKHWTDRYSAKKVEGDDAET
jgi:hypothetical protein